MKSLRSGGTTPGLFCAPIGAAVLVWITCEVCLAFQEASEDAPQDRQAADESPQGAPAEADKEQQPEPKQKQAVPQRQFFFRAQFQLGRGGFARGGLAPAAAEFRTDRPTLLELDRAASLIEEERFTEAARILGDILAAPEDFFLPSEAEPPRYESIKRAAERMIGAMPKAGRDAYELEFGDEARRLLNEAARTGDVAALADIVRRFFHTSAGYEAAYLWGTFQLQLGQAAAALAPLERLAAMPAQSARFEPALSLSRAVCLHRSQRPNEARTVLEDVRARFRDSEPTIAGSRQAWFAPGDDALEWLESWTGAAPSKAAAAESTWVMYRGSQSRNASSQGSVPLLNRRWAVPAYTDPTVERLVVKAREDDQSRGLAPLPGLHPLAVADLVFMRSFTGLEVVDFRTGKRVWNGPVDESLEQSLTDRNMQEFLDGRVDETYLVRQRLWHDATYGTLASDGRRVFCVEDVPLGSATPFGGQPIQVRANGRVTRPIEPQSANRLAAYEIATEGKLLWELGGEDPPPPADLEGAFYLGAPLPIDDALYVLAEVRGEIRLVVASAARGEVQWTQQLADPQQNILDDPLRRLAGTSPSFADGVLVCPTSAGAIVAVDPWGRTLHWGYVYTPRTPSGFEERRQRMFALGGIPLIDALPTEERWFDSVVTIAGDRVLATPVDSDELHCLALRDGSSTWTMPRGDGLYLGCVENGIVVVVGRAGISGLRLADGRAAWPDSPVMLPGGSTPSGRGYASQGRYYVPLASGEVAVYEIATGRLVSRAQSRSGSVPGNLICYHGAVISQTVDGLECFFQLEELRQQLAADLVARPDDPAVLARYGELLLDEGKPAEAIAQLRRAVELGGDPRTRELLAMALLEGLRTDFAAHEEHLPLLEELLSRPEQHAEYLRLVAEGQADSGDSLASLETMLRILDAPRRSDQLERIDQAWEVRCDRWVSARLPELFAALPAEHEAAAFELLSQRFEAAQALGTAAVRTYFEVFGAHPAASEHLAQWHDLLAGERLWLEHERWLSGELRRAEPGTAGATVARMANLLRVAGRPAAAAAYYRVLGTDLADEVCLNGQTGRQLVEALADDDPVRHALDEAYAWPVGAVEVTDDTNYAQSAMPRFLLERRGPAPTAESYMTVEWDLQYQSLVGRDGLGREVWRAPLRERPVIVHNAINTVDCYYRAIGHLLVVCTGFHVLAVDTLGSSDGTGARVLWSQDLTDLSPGEANLLGRARIRQMNWGAGRIVIDTGDKPLGHVGPLSADMVCFQRSRHLLAVNPQTGDTLWARHDLPAGCEIFGDSEVVLAVAPDAVDAVFLRALDGAVLGRRDVPPPPERLAWFGRHVLTWSPAAARLRLTDVAGGHVVWEHAFGRGAKTWVHGEEAVGVLDRDGNLAVVSLADGRKLLEAKVDPQPRLESLYLFRAQDTWLAFANRSWEDNFSLSSQPESPRNALVHGTIFGFDAASGAPLFATPIENQFLHLDQTAGLPIVAMLCNRYPHLQNNGNQSPYGVVTCLDVRTGRLVYDERLAGPINSVEVETSDAGEPVLSVRTMRSGARLRFTSEPLPAGEAAPAEPPSDAEKEVDGDANS